MTIVDIIVYDQIAKEGLLEMERFGKSLDELVEAKLLNPSLTYQVTGMNYPVLDTPSQTHIVLTSEASKIVGQILTHIDAQSPNLVSDIISFVIVSIFNSSVKTVVIEDKEYTLEDLLGITRQDNTYKINRILTEWLKPLAQHLGMEVGELASNMLEEEINNKVSRNYYELLNLCGIEITKDSYKEMLNTNTEDYVLVEITKTDDTNVKLNNILRWTALDDIENAKRHLINSILLATLVRGSGLNPVSFIGVKEEGK